jgi:tRNA(Phe) wybutosine-synthesizing methylase Tyw3
MAPEHKNSDAGGASNTKRSCDVLSISEKVKILDTIEIEKNCMRRLPSCLGRMTFICEVMKNKEQVCASLYVAPQPAEVTAIVHDEVLIVKSLKFLGGRYEKRGHLLTAMCYG